MLKYSRTNPKNEGPMETLHPIVCFSYYIAAIALTVLIRNPAVTLGALVGGL